ncbi:thioredoxin reductase [Pelagophyceae sp. CCMP2097]|nr:thioredoxin reductase [Pelagophyceae sp. CCMP2097]
MMDDGFSKDHGFDYDVVVIGGGSGGLATSKECARLGARTACLDFVKPSPAGSTWGLGGTCVNVGCIPKKLMHTVRGGESAQSLDAARKGLNAYLFFLVAHRLLKATHDWAAMRNTIQDYIKSLNFKYRVALRDASVTYVNALGTFVGDHTLELTDKKGKTSQITAARFVVAVGGRPTALDCEGGHYAVDSDDVFTLDKAPGRVCVVGGGYIALECGGFLAGLGYPVTCMVRSVVLRGFDRECIDKVAAHIQHHGVTMMSGVIPSKIEKLPSGAFKVTDSAGGVGEYDTVLAAVGRTADTTKLGVELVPGALASIDKRTSKLICKNEQLTAPHLYAIGDVVANEPELTPVAIEAGLRLARRLFGDSKEAMDYKLVATTVFTPLEYGVIGLSEEDAKAELGEANIEVYISEFGALEHAVSPVRFFGRSLVRALVDKSNNVVIGFHYLGPNAGEITQGFSVAMRMKATYQDFASTVGIHPTAAEEFTNIAVTKASGVSAAKGGC